MSTYFWGLLALIALAVTFLLLTIATIYVRRLESTPTLPFSEEIGAAPHVIKKLRKRESMTPEEFEYAQRIVAIRGNPMAFCIPFTLFALSTYYVFGCLEYLQGATPSERTFIGVIPMFTSSNLAIQLLRAKRLKGRLRTTEVVAEAPQFRAAEHVG
ncbi:hypothetical protein [Mycobacterium sp.]|uniref:hypothetical protein n=1 Tax=Mycobacterium sp. TaxID=1785 RepID=UPI0025DC20F1|nr:hypothetical protein [Mycobacterium sp.]